ncbi:hypothetical protein D3C78_1123040 [compost metagenome]
MHRNRRYALSNIEGLRRCDDLIRRYVAKRVVPEPDAEVGCEPVGADYAAHRFRAALLHGHALSGVRPCASAVAVKYLGGIPTVLVSVGIVVI